MNSAQRRFLRTEIHLPISVNHERRDGSGLVSVVLEDGETWIVNGKAVREIWIDQHGVGYAKEPKILPQEDGTGKCSIHEIVIMPDELGCRHCGAVWEEEGHGPN